jgi:hypothetical protein
MGMVTGYIFSTPEGEARIRMKVSIVIPVYNERAFIEEVSLRVLAVPIDKEIIFHSKNCGKGAALRRGCR